MFSANDPSAIDRFFRGVTEYAFHARLGVIDPPLVDYVALLLVRFLRTDGPRPLPVAGAAETVDVARMLVAAAAHDLPDEAREEYRHVGDVTLFWSGLYPEALGRPVREGRHGQFDAYREAGKRAYWIASTLEPADATDERELLERLSHDYDLCVEGLAEVRRVWGDAA